MINLEIGDYISSIPTRFTQIALQNAKNKLYSLIKKGEVYYNIDKIVYDYIKTIEFECKLGNSLEDFIDGENINRLIISNPLTKIYYNQDIALNNIGSSEEELCAQLDVIGLYIRVIWLEGNIIQARYLGVNNVEFDVTNIVKNCIDEYMPALEGYGLVETRGKLTCTNESVTSLDTLINNLESKSYQNVLYIVEEIHSENLNFNNKVDMLTFIENAGFNIQEYWCITASDLESVKNNMIDIIEDINEIYNSEYNFDVKDIMWWLSCEKVLKINLKQTKPIRGVVSGVSIIDNNPVVFLKDKIEDAELDVIPLINLSDILELDIYQGKEINFYHSDNVGSILCNDEYTPLLKGYINKVFINNEL